MTEAAGFTAAGPFGPAVAGACSSAGAANKPAKHVGGSAANRPAASDTAADSGGGDGAPNAPGALPPKTAGSLHHRQSLLVSAAALRRKLASSSPAAAAAAAASSSPSSSSSSSSSSAASSPASQHPPAQPQPQPCPSPLVSSNPDPASRRAPSAPTRVAAQAVTEKQQQRPVVVVARQPPSSPSSLLSSPCTSRPAPTAAAPAAATSPAEACSSPDALARVADASPTSPSPSSPPPSSPSSPSSSLSTLSPTPPKADAAQPEPRWAPAPPCTSGRPLLYLATQRRHAAESGSQSPRSSSSAVEAAHGRRELLLPKRLSQSSSSDESRHSSSSPGRPPVSYKPPTQSSSSRLGASTPVRVPPIRAFRSSSSRRSLPTDMSFRPRPYDLDEDRDDAGDDATLRALDGAFAGVDGLQHAGAGDRQHGPSADDTGDVFLKIAREEPLRGAKDETSPESSQISAYRGHRSLHRRPLSTAVVGYHTTSPPQPCRRLSDHRDRPRFEHRDDDQATEISHTTAYRLLAREKAASVHPAEDTMYTGRPRAGSAGLRPSALAPRSPQVVFQDPMPDASAYARRRSSITDGNGSSPSAAGRLSAYKTSATGSAYGKAYNSSPLVRTFDSPNRPSPEHAHGGEGAESTMSTTAPSTVWDELDDLKSRIHRLELTGKLPSSSGTAASRLSDERPATATTTVTTASLSPKRQAGRSTEAASNASSQKEAHSILHAALAKSKPFISPDVYRALESAALDAMGLSTMMGTPGQPGPISSGASTIGSGSSITDRQLRRKADGVCRSLTELCVALGEDVAAQPRPAQPAAAQLDGPATPTIPKSYSGLPPPRKSSLAPENGLPKSNSSPRALSRFEERRNSLLNGTALPSPRAGAPSAPAANEANASRRSSLMVSRTRRTGIEEPDDGRNTSLLRSRRAGTEEPDEGRKTSFLVRNRRGTVGEESDESRFRAPSRANTDVNMLRGQAPEPQTTPPDSGGRTATGLSRRRFVSTSLHSSRLAAPTGSGVTPPRRYLERSAADHEAASARPAEEHGPRPPPLSQGISHLRANSLIVQRQNRDSMTSNTSPAAVASTFR